MQKCKRPSIIGVKKISSKHISFIFLFVSIIIYILLSLKNITRFGYFEEDNFLLYYRDEVIRLDGNERVWCDCKENEKTTCKRYGPFTFRECAPNLSLKVANKDIPILIGPHMGATASILLKIYLKSLDFFGIKGKDIKWKIILIRSFSIIVSALIFIIGIFILTSKIFGHPAAGVSSVLISTDTTLVVANSCIAYLVLPINYLPFILIFTNSFILSLIILRIRIKIKVLIISMTCLVAILLPFIIYNVGYVLLNLEPSTDFGYWLPKYAFKNLVSSWDNFINNFLYGLIFIFGNEIPGFGRSNWILKGDSGQTYIFEVLRAILIAVGFLNFIISERNHRLKYFLILFILIYVLHLSLFNAKANHYVGPSIVAYIASSKGITELKIRSKFILKLYAPFVLIFIPINIIGFIITSKNIVESNPDKLLESKMQVIDFLKKNNIKKIVEFNPRHDIPIGMLTDGETKVVSYVIALKNSIENNIWRTKFYRDVFSIEKNSVFIYAENSPNSFYYFRNLIEKLGFKVKILVSHIEKHHIVVFTVE